MGRAGIIGVGAGAGVLAALAVVFMALFAPESLAVIRYRVDARPAHLDYIRTVHARMDASTPPGSAVFLGDSLMMALPASSIADGSVNFAIGSQTSGELLETLPSFQSVKTARIVFVMVGTNDIARGKAGDLPANYASILSAIPQDTPVVFSSIPPATEFSIEAVRQARTEGLLACSRSPRCQFVDLQSALMDGDRIRSEMFLSDGVHLSPAGVDVWRAMLRDQAG